MVMGANHGEIKYKMKNPYFGLLEPESGEYFEVKHSLREMLKSNDRKARNNGKFSQAM